jgi:diaminohydroxyphosphoribosylaminopyrimidine deaminase/5-amino-6-(5-phosphoribosylamino)uracil reductase
MIELKDFSFLEMAYALAAKARGWASPNPYVGAVVVRQGRIVGWGHHERPGNPHAEIIALRRAGQRTRGGTLYLTLEPCVHWGRTPPCINTVLEAGLKRVVISSPDPNPIVFRKGIRALRRAGIDVSVGLLEERNAALNESYVKFISKNIPFVILKAALSLDGRVATRTFDARWISSPGTRDYVHLLRGECDALMVGINTVIRDDPRLTVRQPQWGKKKMIRVILDAELRLPLQARILSTLSRGAILVFTSRDAPARKKEDLIRRGVEVIGLSSSGRGLHLEEVLAKLGERGVTSLLVEGGSRLLTAMVEGGHADKLFLTFSPRLIGGEKAPSVLEGRGIGLVRESLKIRRLSVVRIGTDTVLEGYF